MQLQMGQQLFLYDGRQRRLGKIVLDEVAGDLVLRRFAAEPDFAVVQHLFAELVEAANQQLFQTVDELDRDIAALDLHLGSANGTPLPAIDDVQIADEEISFRIRQGQGPAAAAENQGQTVP